MINKRVVTVNKDGKSSILKDTNHPRVYNYTHTPGFSTSYLWATKGTGSSGDGSTDAALEARSFCPAPGETMFYTVTLPPDATFADPNFNFVEAGKESLREAPGLAELFEPDAPGFHTTPTVDYVIVLDGELVLETDEEEIELGPHDTVIQNGTRHAWRNRTDKPATFAVVMHGVNQ